MRLSAEGRRVTLLGVLAVVLGGYVYATAPEQQPLGIRAGEKVGRPVLEFSPDQVQRVELLFEKQHVVCQRTATGWQQAPGGQPLRNSVVDDFLDNLTKLVNLGAVESDVSQAAEYGLQPPAARISLQIDGQGNQTLTLGNRNPVQTSLYAQVNDTPQVVLVGAVVLWDMRKLVTAASSTG